MTGWLSSNADDDALADDGALTSMCSRRSVNRLDGGPNSDSERREIVQLLVRRITVHTTVPKQGRKQIRIAIDYRFPVVATTGSVMDSLPQPA